MKIHILLFGVTRDLTGSDKLVFDVPSGTTVSEFRKQLEARYPELERAGSVAIAVNSEYARAKTVIHPGDEIALIPPVSGG